MLQIHNTDNGKSEWNINETHIIIPMIDADNKESDKILTSTLTLNSLEGGDQAILTNGLEHSLVIGLDKTLFETSNYKSDLVIIQNSDMKNPVAYALSYVDQDKNEILWQSSSPKDKMCASSKAILEVRDILNYDVHEMEKNEQITLASLDSDIASHVTKTDGEILTNAMAGGKKDSQCNDYYTSPQNSENSDTVSVLPQFDMTKFIESEEPAGSKKILENKSELTIKPSDFGLGDSTQGIPLNVVKEGMEINLLPMKLVENASTAKKDKVVKNVKAKGENLERKDEGFTDLQYEESLPLKKKAKMKRTLMLVNSETQKSLLKEEMISDDQLNSKFSFGRKAGHPPTTANLQGEEEQWSSDSDEPLINKVTRRKRSKVRIDPKKWKKSNPEVDEFESNKPTSDSLAEDSPRRTDLCEFDVHKFNNIFDLIECLRKCRMINGTVWQTLQLGLKEMKVDILKEMNAKKNEEFVPESSNYSPQLKAFALVLYFKQPAAFNHLAHVYKAGWPTLNIIKEWKRRLNNHQRPNFVSVRQRESPNT